MYKSKEANWSVISRYKILRRFGFFNILLLVCTVFRHCVYIYKTSYNLGRIERQMPTSKFKFFYGGVGALYFARSCRNCVSPPRGSRGRERGTCRCVTHAQSGTRPVRRGAPVHVAVHRGLGRSRSLMDEARCSSVWFPASGHVGALPLFLHGPRHAWSRTHV